MPQDHNHTRTIRALSAELLPAVAKLLDEGHTVTLPLRGNSMRPFLKGGRDKALLAAAGRSRIPVKGDVVLAETSAGHYVLHRIVAIHGNDIVLLGDANITPEHCRRDCIKAVALGFYRKGSAVPCYTSGFKWRFYSHLWLLLRPVALRLRRRLKETMR